MAKKCRRCLDSKPESEFSIRRDTRKLHSWCILCNKEYNKEWRDKNKQYLKAYNKRRYSEATEEAKAKSKQWKDNNKLHRREYNQRWREENREQYREYIRLYNYNRRRDDIGFRLSKNLRERLRRTLKGNVKINSHISELGCQQETLIWYLESQFEEGMTWDNYGEWEVDHILPLSKFDLEDTKQFNVACHVSNLQPLWKIDNSRKGAD